MANSNNCENYSVSQQGPAIIEKQDREKHSKFVKRHVAKISYVVKNLESSIAEAYHNDKQIISSIHLDNIKHQRLTSQLEEAQKENKQLLNVLQQQYNGNDLSRSASRSQIDLSSSYSTVSMVHLQYKYEELLASHEGLLKVLESRLREMQNNYNENDRLREEIQHLALQISELQRHIKELCEKYESLRTRKYRKISKLKSERNALTEAHSQLLKVLERQQLELDMFLSSELKTTNEPMKSLLLKEVRKNNQLEHENMKLKQEVQFMMLRLNYPIQSEPKVPFDKFLNE